MFLYGFWRAGRGGRRSCKGFFEVCEEFCMHIEEVGIDEGERKTGFRPSLVDFFFLEDIWLGFVRVLGGVCSNWLSSEP